MGASQNPTSTQNLRNSVGTTFLSSLSAVFRPAVVPVASPCRQVPRCQARSGLAASSVVGCLLFHGPDGDPILAAMGISRKLYEGHLFGGGTALVPCEATRPPTSGTWRNLNV